MHKQKKKCIYNLLILSLRHFAEQIKYKWKKTRLQSIKLCETFRSRQGTGVDFDKIYVFCNKCCLHIDKFVFIVVKIKCMNSGRISDICYKVNFTTNYTHCTTTDTHCIKTHTNITIFDTFGRMVPPWDLSISDTYTRTI